MTSDPAIAAEVDALAEVCADAYEDAREMILALRDADRSDRGLAEGLRDFLGKGSGRVSPRKAPTWSAAQRAASSPRARRHWSSTSMSCWVNGVAARLRDRGVATTVLARPDGATMSGELAKYPSVIIAEWATPECPALVGQLSPTSRIVDVGNVIGRGFSDSADLVHFSAISDALASA